MISKVGKSPKSTGYGKHNSVKNINQYDTGTTNANNHVNDSTELSSASQYLRKTNWKLKSINKSEDKIFISFSIDNIGFEAVIPSQSTTLLSNIKYTVKKQFESGLNVVVGFIIRKLLKFDGYSEVNISIPTLNDFFNRIEALHSESSIDNSSEAIINSLMMDREARLVKEFNEINSVLINFLEKYENIYIKFISPEDSAIRELEIGGFQLNI